MRPGILIPAFIALALIWSGVAVVMHITDGYIVTPEKIIALVKEAPWKGGKKPGVAERKAFLEQVVANINRLDFAQKSRLRDEGRNETEDFVFDLTEAERKWFLAQTVEQQFQSAMRTFKALSIEERRRIMTVSQADMRRNGRGNEALDGLVKENDKVFETIIQNGVGEYYKEGDEKRKLLLAPLLEELQSRMQGGRRR